MSTTMDSLGLQPHISREVFTKHEESKSIINKELIGTDLTYKHEIVWKNVFGFLVMHIFAIYGFILLFSGVYSCNTVLWVLFVTYAINMGITVGAHRYFTHKTFKAKPLLRWIFILLQTLAGQNCMFIWARDHRLHHRFSDTDGDPHNSKRGFFFCHIGWIMAKKHPSVIELGRKIDMSDLLADPLVMFQKKYYYPLYFLVALYVPLAVPVYFFGETWTNSLLLCYFARYLFTLHATWLVNSAAHLYGTRPYDKNLQPVESWFVSLITSGEGWHNYHHTFPWDYKAAETGTPLNFSATMIRFLEDIGLAYDLKTADSDMMVKRILRTGDGTHDIHGTTEKESIVTAIGPVHPLNPTYTTKLQAPDAILKPEGLPLYHDKDLLSTEKTERQSQQG